MDKNLRETNNLYVEIMNSIGDNYAKGNLLTWYKFAPFDVNVMLNLSNDIRCFEVA